METIIKRLSNLLSVKSLVTLVLTGVFAFMACTNQISQDFMVVSAPFLFLSATLWNSNLHVVRRRLW